MTGSDDEIHTCLRVLNPFELQAGSTRNNDICKACSYLSKVWRDMP